MRAFVVSGPGRGSVEEVDPPFAGPGQVVVDVQRVGVCGTDAEFLSGEMVYLHAQPPRASYPIRIGHEWCGVVSAVGEGVERDWLGRRVTGDTMLGCGHCDRCRDGRQHLCAERFEIGIAGGWPGALAEQLPIPACALHVLPDTVDVVAGALVEPGGNALRAVDAAGLRAGQRLLVWGSGTIGLLCALIALARGVEVHVVGLDPATLELAATLGVAHVWRAEKVPALRFDAMIDATNSPAVPARALDLVEPGQRVVFIGIAGSPSTVDSRVLVLKDLTAIGILGGSAGLAGTIELYASGQVDPRPLVGATIALDQVADALAGHSFPGPKLHVDPRR